MKEKKNGSDYVTKDYLDQKFSEWGKVIDEKFENFAIRYIMPLYKDFQTMKGEINIMKADINVIKADINVIKGDIVTMKSDIVDMKIDISDLKKDMKDVKKTLQKHDVQITALQDWTRVKQ